MAKVALVNVARFKPQTSLIQGGERQIELDMQWPYRMHRVVLDSDVVEEHMAIDLSMFHFSMETSVDGKNWLNTDESWIPSSPKSRQGTGPSFVCIMKEAVLSRYVRIRIPVEIANPRLRALSIQSDLQNTENQKYLIKDELKENIRTVSVGIVGDSNTVMRYGMKRSLDTGNAKLEFDAALGASSILFAARTLDELNFGKPDALVINANVVEHLLMQDPTYDHQLGLDAVKYILSICLKHKMFPVRVIWPELKYINVRANDSHSSIAPDTYFGNQSELLGIPFIDGYRLLDRLAEAWTRTHVSLFKYRDEAHLSHMPSQIIGRGIRRLLEDMKQSGELEQLSLSSITSRAFVMAGLTSHSTRTFRRHTVRIHEVNTSLIRQKFVELKLGDSLEVPIPEGFEVVGYLINARRCNATIGISGINSVSKRVNFTGYQDDEQAYPFVCVRTLPEPVRPVNGLVTVRCDPFDVSDYPDNISREVASVQDGQDRQLHIGDLVLRSIDEREPIIRTTLDDLDLTDRVVLS